MPPKVKSILAWILVIFLVYAIVTNPERAADVVRASWEHVAGAFSGFHRFFSDLTS